MTLKYVFYALPTLPLDPVELRFVNNGVFIYPNRFTPCAYSGVGRNIVKLGALLHLIPWATWILLLHAHYR